MNIGEVLHESSEQLSQDSFFQKQKINFQNLDQFDVFHNIQNSAADFQNNRDLQQSINMDENEKEQKQTPDQISQDIKQQIIDLKNVAIQLKQKLYEENKSDFDQSIIEYTQQQKKIFKEKIESDKKINIQKTFSFVNQLNKTPIKACQTELANYFEDVSEEIKKQTHETQTEPQQSQAAPVLHNNISDSQSNISSDQGDSAENMQMVQNYYLNY